jgi:hypothetical protein
MMPGQQLSGAAGSAVAGAALARFAEARGRRVFEAMGVLWAQYRWPFFASLPYQQQHDLDPRELSGALRAERVPAVRYPTRTQPGWPCGMYVLAPAGYSLSRISPKRRRLVRRGLEETECRPLDPEELLAQGLELNLETMARHQRFDPEFGEPARWKRLVAAIRDSPGVSIGGGYVRGRLSCYHVNCRDGAWLHLLYKMSRTEDLPSNSSLALDYWTLSEAGKDPTIEAVENGFPSVISGDTLHHYKTQLGFELLPFNVSMRFHPAVQPLLANRWSAGVAGALSSLRPRSRGLERIARVLKGAHLSSAEGGGAASPDLGEQS